MRSSGTTAVATVDDTAVTLIAHPSPVERFRRVVNTGTVAGFVSLDAGTTWNYLPPGQAGVPAVCVFDLEQGRTSAAVKLARVAGGSNVTGVYADSY